MAVTQLPKVLDLMLNIADNVPVVQGPKLCDEGRGNELLNILNISLTIGSIFAGLLAVGAFLSWLYRFIAGGFKDYGLNYTYHMSLLGWLLFIFVVALVAIGLFILLSTAKLISV